MFNLQPSINTLKMNLVRVGQFGPELGGSLCAGFSGSVCTGMGGSLCPDFALEALDISLSNRYFVAQCLDINKLGARPKESNN